MTLTSNVDPKLARQMARWSDHKLDREYAFRDDNGGSPEGAAWVAAVEAEAASRFQNISA